MSAVQDVLYLIYHELDVGVSELPNDVRLRDDLERAIFDVKDIELQHQLRGLLVQIDECSDRFRSALDRVSVYQCLDPIKAIAVDLASGSLCPPTTSGRSRADGT